jgi:hypothetical protein
MFRVDGPVMPPPYGLAQGLVFQAVLPPHAHMKLRHGALALLAAALLIAPSLARAQPVPPVGAEVRDDKGKPVGKVERIILGPDGRPKQAIVRVDRVLRALPVEALQRSGDAYVAVLSRAEIASLPPAE